MITSHTHSIISSAEVVSSILEKKRCFSLGEIVDLSVFYRLADFSGQMEKRTLYS